ncbi:tyrosine-protein phosphatase non-receptor type 18 [Pelobates fuscus]|uniref:tyrosine-protein phosphatase non-receptor type 18 n=1 Tax=Pelobates fuscus TaxID=191477 RepID=UPI002FE4BB97
MSLMANNLRAFLDRVSAAKGTDYQEILTKEFQDIKTQAAAFKQSTDYSTKVGESLENLKKNRYKDILPYDQTRVPVTLLAEDVGSDYINASFIQGWDNRPRYIATQGPLGHTVLDFWRMIWQYNVKVIVMACREVEHGKKKCERYWSLDEGPAQFGPFSICTAETIQVNAEVVCRNLHVTFQDELRELQQFQYVAWPDRGIPDSYTCFLEMIQLVRQYQGETCVPMCVHCSAGCGRTGVICTVEYIQSLLQQQRVPSDFSIYSVVMEIRRQRPSAVQTKEQYDFLYHAITEMFEKQLKVNPNYENLTSNRAPFYDDACSSVSQPRTVTNPQQVLRSSFSLPLDHQSPVHPVHSAMSETYAVIRRPTAAVSPPVPQAPRAALTTEYDNINQCMTPPELSNPVYSIVVPKSNRASALVLTPSTASISSSYAYAEMPSSAEVTTAEYTHVATPSTVDTNTYSNTTNSKNENKWWPHAQNEFPAVPGKKPSRDDYEDVNDPSKRIPAGTSGGLGFNCRIAKPKGPRDPPAEWSR